MGSRYFFRICFRGTYSCYWKRFGESNQRCVCCWSSFLALVSIVTLAWLYVCVVAFNDHTEVNWRAFELWKLRINCYMGVIILTAVLSIYCLLLLLLSLLLFAIKEPVDLHWLHKVLLSVSLVGVVLGTVGVSKQWTKEWKAVLFSLQATAPFLQFAAVVALTMISWFVFKKYHRAQRPVSKIFIIGVFGAVSLVVFLSPLFINSPCINDTLPTKPSLVAHRGAPMLAPENTMMSFRRSVQCNVVAFETDVQLSKDMVPFLMHDSSTNFLLRTTNVDVVFPNRIDNSSSDFTWMELQKLNAGDWFVKTDPFWSVSQLSEEEKADARNQTVPTLSELLELSKEHNISIIFDIKNLSNGNYSDIGKIIQKSGISQDLIWWLDSRHRDVVKKDYPGFYQVYPNQSTLENDNGSRLNMDHRMLSVEEIRGLRSRNVSVNLWGVNERWLFSLLWCSGVSSVTTNSCHVFKDMSEPDWHLTPYMYKIIWITADVMSLVLMFMFFLFQRWCCNSHAKGKLKQEAFSSWNQKEVYPFLESNQF